jgi:methyl-accepting chemotaxis protein
MDIDKTRMRKIILSDQIQVKYAVLLSIVLIALLGLSQFYTYVTLQNILPHLLSTTISEKVSALQTSLLMIGFLYVVVISLISIYVTHSLAGPIARIEKDALKLSENPDLAFRFKTREKDEFKGLANALNSMMDKLQKTCVLKENAGEQGIDKKSI